MTEQDQINAADAEDLRQNPTFQRAVLAIRKTAVERLIASDPTDSAAVMARQAEIKAIDALCTEVAAVILRGTPQRPTIAVA